MATKIQIREFSTMPELASEGWNPNACDANDYASQRAHALYDALGVDLRDDEYALAMHTDGRMGLFGLTVVGHEFAVETGTDDALDRAREILRRAGVTDKAGLGYDVEGAEDALGCTTAEHRAWMIATATHDLQTWAVGWTSKTA